MKLQYDYQTIDSTVILRVGKTSPPPQHLDNFRELQNELWNIETCLFLVSNIP